MEKPPMSTYRTIRAALCLASFMMFAGPAVAQTSSNSITFSGPVLLPGVELPAGSYTFAVIGSGRTVVVSDINRHVIATLQVTPITRSARGDMIAMRAAVAGRAPEISALYSGGGTTGVEFLYPRPQK